MSTNEESDDPKAPSREERRAALLARWKEIEGETEGIQRELSEEGHSHVGISLIHHCPDEVLLRIFKCYLETGHDDNYKSQHPYIRRLLLICKRWNHLVIATKKLWARIEIKNGNDLFDFPTQKSLVPYINACFERSEDLLLDVELDLFGLSSFGGYIAEVVNRYDERILSDVDYRHVASSIQVVKPDYCSRWYEVQFKKAFDCLLGVGPDDTFSTRYRSLKIIFPEDQFLSQDVIERLVIPFPRLISLQASRQINLLSDDLDGAFPSLPIVERLGFDDHSLHIRHFNVSPVHLRHLNMRVNRTLSNMRELPSFSQLRTLEISFFVLVESIAVPRITIELPHLHTLSLSGPYSPLLGVDLHLPSLDLLIIQTSNMRSRLPKLYPRRIMWDFDEYSYEHGSKDDIVPLIRDVILLSPITKTITFSDLVRQELLVVLRELGQEWADSTPNHMIINIAGDCFVTISVVDRKQLTEVADDLWPHSKVM